jgi:DNA-binding Lrp family transcriptional regulator
VVAPDPVDVRLLSLIAEAGRAAVHEVAARMGMDPREVASRLVALSANGLPLVVGVECDPNGIRAALAAMAPPVASPPAGFPSGAYQVQGTPSGTYPPPPQSGPYPVATPSGQYQVAAPYPAQQQHPGYQPPPPMPPRQNPVYPPSQSFPAPPDPVLSTWGPPQSASWARGDQQPGVPQQLAPAPVRSLAARTGKVGGTLETEGLEGEFLTIQLVELVDPADYLFTAAGYRLQPGERSVVVHTELVNRGAQTFNSLPDLYLVLVAKDGQTIAKAPVSLSSRPPHRIGVAPGETAGGHTVYVLPEDIEVTAVRWSPRPDDTTRTLTWTVEL